MEITDVLPGTALEMIPQMLQKSTYSVSAPQFLFNFALFRRRISEELEATTLGTIIQILDWVKVKYKSGMFLTETFTFENWIQYLSSCFEFSQICCKELFRTESWMHAHSIHKQISGLLFQFSAKYFFPLQEISFDPVFG